MKRVTTSIASILTLTLFLAGCSATSTNEKLAEVGIDNAWVRVSEYSDHVGGMTGVFGEFTNNTDHVVTIVGGTSDIAGMVEAHEVVMKDGAMTMQAKQGGIAIQPGETVTLEPGGLHIMLMGLSKAILEGDEISVTIDLDGANDITLTVPAKASLAGDETYSPKPSTN